MLTVSFCALCEDFWRKRTTGVFDLGCFGECHAEVLRSIWPRASKHRSFASTLRMTASDLVAAEGCAVLLATLAVQLNWRRFEVTTSFRICTRNLRGVRTV